MLKYVRKPSRIVFSHEIQTCWTIFLLRDCALFFLFFKNSYAFSKYKWKINEKERNVIVNEPKKKPTNIQRERNLMYVRAKKAHCLKWSNQI